jgi:hypothetical protein
MKNRLIGKLSKVGIRLLIDRRESAVHESLELQTMNMLNKATNFIKEKLWFPSG